MNINMFVANRANVVRFVLLIFAFLHVQLICAEDVDMHFTNVHLCRGDSFPLKSYLENQVEVPIDCQLLGWENLTMEHLCPLSDTTIYLLYRQKNSELIQKKEFNLKVRNRPIIEIQPLSFSYVCVGDDYPNVTYTAENCDRIYWKDALTGREEVCLDSFGIVDGGEDIRRFYVVGSNEQCAEAVYAEVNIPVVDASRFQLKLEMPPDQVSICGDSILLCDYVSPKLLKLYYSDEVQQRVYPPSIQYELEWLQDDEYTQCQSYVSDPYTNRYLVKTSVEENQCHTIVSFHEVHDLELYCTADPVAVHASSYSCVAGNGVIYWGAEYPIADVSFRSLNQSVSVLPTFRNNFDYNMDTYQFPYKGSATLCWSDIEMNYASFEISFRYLTDSGDTISVVDTLNVSACQKSAPIVQYECFRSDHEGVMFLGSMDSIVSVSFFNDERIHFSKSAKKSSTQKGFYYAETFSFDWEEVKSDTLNLKIEMSYLNCYRDTVSSSKWVTISNCAPNKRIYYGSYKSAAAVLLQKEDCMVHQCSNIEGEEPRAVETITSCSGDTVYLKFKGVGFQLDSYTIQFLSDDTFWVEYPAQYQRLTNNVFQFDGNNQMNPTLAFVPKKDFLLEGNLQGIPFAFEINVKEEIVNHEYSICQGDTLDLSSIVKDNGNNLSWNVGNTKVSPLKDSEYYLYGFSENGCLVDEKVMIKIKYPLWYRVAEDTFCDGSVHPTSDLLHTNATRLIWYENNELVDIDNGLFLQKGNQYDVRLFTVCDSAQYQLPIKIEDCQESNENENGNENENLDKGIIKRLYFPQFLLPDGDGLNDVWEIEGLTAYNRWQCKIYNRFGKIMASYFSVPVVWDGTYNGVLQPTTDYWYQLWLDDEQTPLTGHFTLLRE